MKNILVTGGTGYIGSHTVVLLVEAGWMVTVIDNLANSNTGSIKRIAAITKKPEQVEFFNVDLRDEVALEKLFSTHSFDSVIHFAGYKAVGEAKQKPLLYYSNNIKGTVNLIEAMNKFNVKKLVFSSSCTVYGESPSPLTEESQTGFGITNAYSRSKYQIEQMLMDVYNSDPTWQICVLRYFNPVGAHESGLLGEDPRGIPNCLMPYVLQVLVGRLPKLTIYGDNYETRDGTPIRDYIHVVDVARGHIDAISYMAKYMQENESKKGIFDTFNFGTGKGTTVFELVHALEKASGKTVPYVVGPPRAGDLTASYANPEKAEKVLGWKAIYDIDTICRDAWKWQSLNPNGFDE
jgi:UDP-glucose 4-epimerase